ncbi:MAG: SDR family NAD(P)-dependent oxidoreductase [Terricaulis sp.]
MREIGLTPAKSVERLRLDAARAMLESGAASIQDVARKTGFGDSERMRRAFIRFYGAPPALLRGPCGALDLSGDAALHGRLKKRRSEASLAKRKEEQKTIFITGAGSGIGRATALLFAERGWFVGAFDVDAEGLEQTAALLPEGRRLSSVFDVRDRAGWTRAVRNFGEATGGLMHVLFNNAGVARGGWFEDIAPDDADLIVDVNIKGVINGCYAALPLLREATGGAHRECRFGRGRLRHAAHGGVFRDQARGARID